MAETAFALRPLETPEPLINLFSIVGAVVGKNPAVLVTLDRFNTSLLRSNIYDQVIDITISLESIVESSVEIKFRFSLYNALLAEPDTAKRRDTFELLQKLYDVRSSIVHGDISSKSAIKKIGEVKQNFKEIQRLAVAVISYYLLFHFKDPKKSWKNHLDGLALGAEDRVSRTESPSAHKRIRSNLVKSMTGVDHVVNVAAEIYLPTCQADSVSSWACERRFLDEWSNPGQLPDVLAHRLDLLLTGAEDKLRGFRQQVFLPDPMGLPLRLRKNSIFFPSLIDPANVSQADVFFAVSTVLHKLRGDPSGPGSPTTFVLKQKDGTWLFLWSSAVSLHVDLTWDPRP